MEFSNKEMGEMSIDIDVSKGEKLRREVVQTKSKAWEEKCACDTCSRTEFFEWMTQ